MPAGDLVDAAAKYELRATLLGKGTDLEPSRRVAIGGLGATPVKPHDLDLTAATGTHGGNDDGGVRTITIPLRARTQAALRGLIDDTTGTWRRSNTDLQLFMWVPLLGKFYVWGRPRGADVDTEGVTFGMAEVLCTFVTTADPTLHFV